MEFHTNESWIFHIFYVPDQGSKFRVMLNEGCYLVEIRVLGSTQIFFVTFSDDVPLLSLNAVNNIQIIALVLIVLHFDFLWVTKLWSLTWVGFLEVLDVAGTNSALCRSRKKYPRAGGRVCICVPYLRAWCFCPHSHPSLPVSLYSMNPKLSLFSKIPRALRWARTQRVLEIDRAS